MKERFAWAKGAQLRAGGAALEADLRRALSGAPFRIGGPGALAAKAGQFETLTSGSSGAPRRILREAASWTASFAVNAGLFGIGAGCHVATLGGLEQSLSLYGAIEALHLGADVSVLAGLPPARQLAGLAGVDVLWASPAQLRLMLVAKGDLRGLAHVVIGGSKLDDALRAALQARTGAQVTEFYGAAEASFITLARAGAPVASVGAPYPGVDLRVDQGQVWVRSPYLFIGYAGDDVGNDTGCARWHNGWLSVGEMGQMHGGQLYLHGRAGRMVTVADHNVFPEEIEARLMAMPGVVQAAVLPRRDAMRGVHLVALCQGQRAREAEIMAGLRAALGPLRAPKAIVWREDWPHLPSGKTDLRALQAWVDAWP